jgi:putative RNA 2'-phosphotransferase
MAGTDRHRAERLSRLLSLILRHRPQDFGLTLDPHGWVSVTSLLEAVRRQRGWEDVTAEDLEAAVRLPGRRRFEIREGRMRALYGHSIPVQPEGAPHRPPEWLYHGTAPERLPAILSEGLRPGTRRFVHLSLTPLQAREVGQRHSPEPVVLTVLARRAHEAGVAFYRASGDVYLADAVPQEFLLVEPARPTGTPVTPAPGRSAPP